MSNFGRKGKDGIKSKPSGKQQAPATGDRAVVTAALRALEVASLGTSVLPRVPVTVQPSSSSNSYLVGFKNALTILEKCTDDIGIPGLQGVVGTLLTVLEDIDQSAENNDSFEELTKRIDGLKNIFTATFASKQAIPQAWLDPLENLQRVIISITDNIQQLSSQGKVMQVFTSRENSSKVQAYIQELDRVLIDLQTAVNVGVGFGVSNLQDNLRNMQDFIMSKDQEERFNTLLHVPGAAYNSSSREFAPRCLGGTRVDLLKKIQEWIEDKTPGAPFLFWLNGLAGTGKSTIAHSIAEYCDGEGRHMLGATFFFSRDQEERRSTRCLIPTLAFQLGNQYPPLKLEIAKALTNTSTQSLNMQHQLQKLILEPFSVIKDSFSSPVTIILDALDECEEADAVAHLVQLFASELHAAKLPLKIFITSRPERHLRLTFSLDDVHPKTGFIILHEIELPVVQKDIRMFLKFRLAQIAKKNFDVLDPATWPVEDDIETLVNRAAGLFIYASTVIKFIDSDDDPQDQLAAILKQDSVAASESNPFIQLDQLYEQIIQTMMKASSKAAASFITVVGSIILLFNRLSCKDLSQLLGMTEKNVILSLRNLHSVIIVPETGGLLQAFHPSFHDYLTDKSRCINEKFFIDPALQHAKIAGLCLDHMMECLKRDICGISDPSLLNEEVVDIDQKKAECIPQYLQYACLYWMSHLLQCPPSQDLVEKLHKFSFKSILYWIETLSLIGGLSSGLLAVQQAHKWILNAPEPPNDLIGLLYDVDRFILEFFDCISKGALHVYYSALPFTPPETIISQVFKGQLQNCVTVLKGRPKTWDSCLRTIGHPDMVDSVAFSSDSKYIATCSANIVSVWITETGELLHKLAKHLAVVTSAQFSPDGKFIVSGSRDKTLRVWDTEKGEALHKLSKHLSDVTSVKYSHNGKLIASGSDDRTIRIWSTETWKSLFKLKGHKSHVSSVSFSPDSKYIASASGDSTVKIWDLDTGEEMHTLLGHSYFNDVVSVAFSPDGKSIASGSWDGTIRIWSTVTYETEHVVYLSQIMSVAFSANSELVVAGTADEKTVSIWNRATGEAVNTFIGHGAAVNSVAFSSDGHLIVSGSNDKTVRIWDAEVSSLHVLHEPSSGIKPIQCVEFSLDGKLIVTGSWDLTVKIWNAKTGEVVQTFPVPSNTPRCATISQDSKLVASGHSDKLIWIHDIATGEPVCQLLGHTEAVTCVAFSPGCKYIASGSGDCSVKIWDIEIKQVVHTLEGHASQVNSVVFSSNGQLLLSGSADKTTRIWRAHTGEAVNTLSGHSEAIYSVAFCLDDLLIRSSSLVKQIHWTTATGVLVAPDEFHWQTSTLSNTPHKCESLIVRGDWVCFVKGKYHQRLCWLPPSYQGSHTYGHGVSYGQQVAIGALTGRLVILNFSNTENFQ